MGWLYVPGLAVSTLGSSSPSETITEPFVTLSGKPTQRPLSWHGWQRRLWIKHLYGTISRPSMASRGVESWISLLRDTRASLSVSLVKDAVQTIRDTFGQVLPESSGKSSQLSFSVRTSPAILTSDSVKSPENFRKWAIAWRRYCALLPTLDQRMNGNGCSYWATATVSGDHNRKGASPRSGDGLATQAAAFWPTTAARDWKESGSEPVASARNSPNQPAVAYSFHQTADPKTGEKLTKRLNPLFREWLMGLPIGWTLSAPLETQSFHVWQQRHLSNLFRLWTPDQRKRSRGKYDCRRYCKSGARSEPCLL